MAHRYRLENTRGRSPERILAFERQVFRPTVESRPGNCRCTWVPNFVPVKRRPAGPSDPRPEVLSWQVHGFRLKFTDQDCPVRRQHG